MAFVNVTCNTLAVMCGVEVSALCRLDPPSSIYISPFNLFVLPYTTYSITVIQQGGTSNIIMLRFGPSVRNAVSRKYAKNTFQNRYQNSIYNTIQNFKLLNLNRLTFAY